MKKTLSILIGKLVLKIGLLLKKNMSVYPGFISMKLDKEILKKFDLPKIIIAVTGSSGKGSTASLISNILNDNNISSIYNNQDSNKDDAIVTLFLKHCDLKGKINKGAIVLEVDERYCKHIFKYINPTHVVITNITRDQPPRQGNYDLVSNEIKKALTNEMHLILNGDDPYLDVFIDKNLLSYYSLNKTKYSYISNTLDNLNMVYCPKCSKKLKYHYYHIESTGDFYCDCGFKKNIGTSGDLKNKTLNINGNKIKLKSDILYTIYNNLAAYTTTNLFLSGKEIENSLNKLTSKGVEIYDSKNRKITVLNSKAENASTYNQGILYVNRFKEKKDIVIGWKEISRRYKHFDTSWLYDIDFESLKNIDTAICVGINRFDIATRIKHANIKCNIKTYKSLEEASVYLHKSKNNIYSILNFDYVNPFNKIMKEGKQ